MERASILNGVILEAALNCIKVGPLKTYKIKEKQVWVWSWLRMNAGDKPNTCKSNASNTSISLNFIERDGVMLFRGVANGWVTRKNLPHKSRKDFSESWILRSPPGSLNPGFLDWEIKKRRASKKSLFQFSRKLSRRYEMSLRRIR